MRILQMEVLLTWSYSISHLAYMILIQSF